MTLNLDKCIIGKKEIPWWGMIITDKGIKPDPEKVEALRHATPPRNRDEVLSFLCMIQSNKEFLPNLATKTTHLRQLTKKNQRFKWDDACELEFRSLCKDLREDTLVRHYDPKQPTYIFVDAHQTGISAILSQGESIESSRPVAFASRATTSVESRYPQLDLEALAIDYGLRRFRFYLVGGPETATITDHKPLEAIFRNNRSGSIRTERIKLRHQDIRYKVTWRDGKSNPADYLSRHAVPIKHVPKTEADEPNELEKTVWFLNFGPFTEAVSMEDIIKETKHDKTLRKLRKALQRDTSTKTTKSCLGIPRYSKKSPSRMRDS
jgi:hypothetical protein